MGIHQVKELAAKTNDPNLMHQIFMLEENQLPHADFSFIISSIIIVIVVVCSHIYYILTTVLSLFPCT